MKAIWQFLKEAKLGITVVTGSVYVVGLMVGLMVWFIPSQNPTPDEMAASYAAASFVALPFALILFILVVVGILTYIYDPLVRHFKNADSSEG